MELLIPGLILVALMVWASTKIKKTAADAFEPEFVETEKYSLQKPQGFLHVIDDPEHAFNAYSQDFGKGDHTGIRQATIEVDLFPIGLAAVRDMITQAATETRVRTEGVNVCELETDETVNEIDRKVVYKIIADESGSYRLRFAVLHEYFDEYSRRIDATLDSFTIT